MRRPGACRADPGGQPNAASKKGGARNWEPLLYLCATRLPLAPARDNAVAIARALLDHGADPNAYYPGGDASIRYTALTVLVGEGEEDAARHPRHGELVQLLLQRGAEPYDVQLFYNTHFHGDILWLMPLIYDASVKLGRDKDWSDPEWCMIEMGGYGKGSRYILGGAGRHNWGSTPLAWAVYGLKWPMIDLLTPYTRDVWNLAAAGKVERLRELLAKDASLARIAHPNGYTPLMLLPDEEARSYRNRRAIPGARCRSQKVQRRRQNRGRSCERARTRRGSRVAGCGGR